MGTLYNFPASPELTIYLPHGSSPDEYDTYLISDDSLSRGTIYQGDVVVIKLGLIQAGGLHVIQTPAGHTYAGFLVDKGNGLVSIECNNEEYKPEVFQRDEIKILGRVVQVYPGGDSKQHWELVRHPRAFARRAAK
jgi:SOS-response transcriptional repressor LexA